MLEQLKIDLYFLVARYFRFFARIRLRRWKPRVVLITGSNGKTLCLNLCEVQLGSMAKYTHHANSAFGICFDILGLKRTSYSPFEWIWLAIATPFCALKGPHKEHIYIAEVDGDRSGEGQFLGSLLQPEVCVWLSVARTHTLLFEAQFKKSGFKTIDETIAHEFGDFAAHASKLVIANTDEPLIAHELKRAKATISELKMNEQLREYAPSTSGTTFTIDGTNYHAPYLLPKEAFYATVASVKVAEYFGKQPKNDLSRLEMPPGRSSVFRGIKNTTIIDSSYNANVASVLAIVRMVENLLGEKWLVLGDLTEQAGFEQEEHERTARMLVGRDFKRIILVGPRMAKYALPILRVASGPVIESFVETKDAREYVQNTIRGNEILVFKGARYLEGIIEHLLENKADMEKLCRREKVWRDRRVNWGL